jgi:hypothetical protein
MSEIGVYEAMRTLRSASTEPISFEISSARLILAPPQLHLVDLAVRDRLFLDSLDAALAERPLLNRKRGNVAPALEARFRIADFATRRLVALGLKRVKRRKTVQEIMAEIANETASRRTNVNDDERGST